MGDLIVMWMVWGMFVAFLAFILWSLVKYDR